MADNIALLVAATAYCRISNLDASNSAVLQRSSINSTVGQLTSPDGIRCNVGRCKRVSRHLGAGNSSISQLVASNGSILKLAAANRSIGNTGNRRSTKA